MKKLILLVFLFLHTSYLPGLTLTQIKEQILSELLVQVFPEHQDQKGASLLPTIENLPDENVVKAFINNLSSQLDTILQNDPILDLITFVQVQVEGFLQTTDQKVVKAQLNPFMQQQKNPLLLQQRVSAAFSHIDPRRLGRKKQKKD